MLHAKTPSYSVMINRLNVANKLNSAAFPVLAGVILSAFAKSLADKQMLSKDVVLAWRDVGVEALKKYIVTFAQWCDIDEYFADYIEAIYTEYPDFVAEVIAQKNMDIRNGETL